MTDPLAMEKAYLKEHQSELSETYPGRYLVIQGENVYGAFETYDQGVNEGVKMLGAGPFLVRSVLQPEDPPPLSIPTLSLGMPISVNS